MPAATSTSLAIDARALTTSYGSRRGIVDVDLTVAPGEVVGLVGANGAGKTTFLRTMLDFIRPTSGTVSVFGLDSVQDSVALRRRTAYLPGDLVLPPRLLAAEAFRRYTAARRPIDPGRVRVLADRLNLDLLRRVEDLSKGNRQKIGLLLAFAPRADVLILDEPTSGLDPLLQREFVTLVRAAVQDGVAVLLSSHVMSEVEQVAHRVALMREGRVTAVDDLAAIHARSRRRGRVRPVDAGDLLRLVEALKCVPGVSDVGAEDGVVTFACAGGMDALVKTLAGFGVAGLDVAHTDLDDAFFSAYDVPLARR